ncbi:hypothetical protein C2845_PM18G02620 [Panicum miliaceum]|uniref:Uncharacterized protein n=1 Tax=Panicum miliaceum TaxID=4540 RepID=A0A3L6PMH4_PANMI|nr:hypothetical protein C2845_PM18G02620 [Panicum miliaceum]
MGAGNPEYASLPRPAALRHSGHAGLQHSSPRRRGSRRGLAGQCTARPTQRTQPRDVARRGMASNAQAARRQSTPLHDARPVSISTTVYPGALASAAGPCSAPSRS